MAVKPDLDPLDLMILGEMEIDGRRSASSLAKNLGISRAYAGRRLQRLLDQQVTRIVAFTNPLVLGYQTVAIIGIQVLPSEINRAAQALSQYPNIYLMLITAGQQDIIIWTMFQSPSHLSEFLCSELGAVPGITSTETMMILEMRKLSFSFVTAATVEKGSQPKAGTVSPFQQFSTDTKVELDKPDLIMLKELEKDARQPISELARKMGTSRASASHRLQRLLETQLTRIVAFTNPFILGYNFFSLIGIKVSPGQIEAAVERLCIFPDLFMVAKTAGRYDIIVWAVFKTPLDLSAFLMGELAQTPGITSTDTIIALELRKMSFMYLASSLRGEE